MDPQPIPVELADPSTNWAHLPTASCFPVPGPPPATPVTQDAPPSARTRRRRPGGSAAARSRAAGASTGTTDSVDAAAGFATGTYKAVQPDQQHQRVLSMGQFMNKLGSSTSIPPQAEEGEDRNVYAAGYTPLLKKLAEDLRERKLARRVQLPDNVEDAMKLWQISMGEEPVAQPVAQPAAAAAAAADDAAPPAAQYLYPPAMNFYENSQTGEALMAPLSNAPTGNGWALRHANVRMAGSMPDDVQQSYPAPPSFVEDDAAADGAPQRSQPPPPPPPPARDPARDPGWQPPGLVEQQLAAAAQARTMAPPLAAMTPANLKETFDAEGLEKLRKKVFVSFEHEHLHWLPLCEWEKRVPIGQPTSVGAKQAVTEAVQVAVWIARNGDGVVLAEGGYKYWTAVRTEARAFAKGQPPTFSWWVEARRMKDVAGMNVND